MVAIFGLLGDSCQVAPGSAQATAEIGLQWEPSQDVRGLAPHSGQLQPELEHLWAALEDDTLKELTGQAPASC